MARPPVITCGIYLYDFNSGKLLICHATNASWKTWSLPKGMKDGEETAYDAAIRELKEETGIDASKLNLLQTAALPPVRYKKQNKVLESFLLITDTSLQDHTFVCNSLTKSGIPEIDRWAWVAPEQLASRLHESQLENYEEILALINKIQKS
ncbi:MAG: hypothetical protein JWO09_3221 [Bacteroidetes bacterium]|nr:hypothetical protein [Bacteroidota bacterium]